MNRWPRALLFDFDGVLVNSEPLHFFAFHDVLQAEGIELTEQEYYRDYIGVDDRGAFRRVYEQHGRPLDPRTFLRVMTAKKEQMKRQIESRDYRPLPGVEEFVRGVWRHYPLGVCSGSLRDEIEAMLEGVRLRDCFQVVVAAEDVQHGKPDPQGYVLATQQISERIGKNLKPADCLVIEDAPAVVKSVRAAGYPVLAVASTCPRDKFANANWIVKTLNPDEVQKQLPGIQMYR